MKRKSNVIVVAIMLLVAYCAPSSFGQDKKSEMSLDSFAGTWVLNFKTSSERVASLIKSKVKGDVIWKIDSSADYLKFNMSWYYFIANSRLELHTDDVVLILHPNNNSETNRVSFGQNIVVIKSKTKLSKDKLVREFTMRTPLRPVIKETEMIDDISEKYALSKNGKQLIFETVVRHTNIPPAPNILSRVPIKLVFDRKE